MATPDLDALRRLVHTIFNPDGGTTPESVLTGAALREFSSLDTLFGLLVSGVAAQGERTSYNDYMWVVAENVASARVSVVRIAPPPASASFALNFVMTETGWMIAALDRVRPLVVD
ncbi:hypothetical protein GYA93_04665 [Gordonia desulfuricans]|uniref:Uncharacterized protein n=1 Tax=Gordonia desulfuricans TaxID=89051 RepID=A0A7K3LKT8_9ACTN|nr:hypothetical protein [Gordonia desulfuricans]NDK88872.1 hypothetical protein [Gordonia desulfuricans]